jgi:hypothetical protein
MPAVVERQEPPRTVRAARNKTLSASAGHVATANYAVNAECHDGFARLCDFEHVCSIRDDAWGDDRIAEANRRAVEWRDDLGTRWRAARPAVRGASPGVHLRSVTRGASFGADELLA